MPALYPSQSAPENFQVGDSVRKWVTEWNVTPFLGVVTQVVPATYKVWVQWPLGNSPEDPETLIKVNPAVSGMPTVCWTPDTIPMRSNSPRRIMGRFLIGSLRVEI
jgi:hypothetical protein